MVSLLAGSGAIREHGVIDRPTEDIDLFTPSQSIVEFSTAVEYVVANLLEAGYKVEEVRRSEGFARLAVSSHDGTRMDLDMGVDWRDKDPAELEVGPVLSIEDAVGNKVSALYSRCEPRDYLDVDEIRRWGRFTDEDLISDAEKRDSGFEVAIFVQ